MGIKWKEELCIDNGIIDNEHKVIIDKANLFLDQDKQFTDINQAKQYLGVLRDHMAIHLVHEEDYQKSIGFSGLNEHKMLHKTLISQLDRILLHVSGLKTADLSEINRLTAYFLLEFLVNHLLNEDMKMKEARRETTQRNPLSDDVVYL